MAYYQAKVEQQAAIIDYIAAMTDVEIPTYEEEETENGEDEV